MGEWIDLRTLPSGTEFWVVNGGWSGYIYTLNEEKYMHVNRTGADFKLTDKNSEYCIKLRVKPRRDEKQLDFIVGDEIKDCLGNKGVILSLAKDDFGKPVANILYSRYLNTRDTVHTVPTANIKEKTGKNYPQIAEILEMLHEDEQELGRDDTGEIER